MSQVFVKQPINNIHHQTIVQYPTELEIIIVIRVSKHARLFTFRI